MAPLTTSVITNTLNGNTTPWYPVTIDKHEVVPIEANTTVQHYKSEENKPPPINEWITLTKISKQTTATIQILRNSSDSNSFKALATTDNKEEDDEAS